MKHEEDRMESGRFAGLSKQEKITLVVLTVASFGTGYLIWELFLAPGGVAEDVRDILGMFYAALMLGVVAVQNYSNGPLEDERDRQNKAKGTAAGYFVLVLSLLVTGSIVQSHGVAVYLGSRTPSWLELYLLLCVAVSVALNHAVRAYGYLRDRLASSE